MQVEEKEDARRGGKEKREEGEKERSKRGRGCLVKDEKEGEDFRRKKRSLEVNEGKGNEKQEKEH